MRLVATFSHPVRPDFRAIADRRLAAVAHDRGVIHLRIILQGFLGVWTQPKISHVAAFISLRLLVDHGRQADCLLDALEFALAQPKAQDVNGLILDFPFLEIAFSLLRVKAFTAEIDLNVHRYCTSGQNKPAKSMAGLLGVKVFHDCHKGGRLVPVEFPLVFLDLLDFGIRSAAGKIISQPLAHQLLSQFEADNTGAHAHDLAVVALPRPLG